MHRNDFGRLAFAALAGMLLASPIASASGIYLPENGAEILGRGGADVGFLDTAYALQFNPAGLTLRDGIDVRLSLNLINPGESFKPADKGLNPDGVTAANSAGLSPDPSVMISYCPHGLKPLFMSSEERGCMIGIGLGLWAPPGILNYSFPDPANFKGTAASTQTPQRYNVIDQTSIVLYPSVGLGFRPIKWLSLGGTLEYVYSNTQLKEAEEGVPTQLGGKVNSTTNDVTANLNVTSIPRVSGLFGALIQILGDETQDLTVSGAYQLYQPIWSKGTLDLALGPDLTNPTTFGLSATSQNTATLNINLPPVARTGVNYRWRQLHLTAEYIWEGWEVNNYFVLRTNAKVTSSSSFVQSTLPASLPATYIQNDWRNTNGVRGGVGYDFLTPEKTNGFHLQGNLGASYESNAVPYHEQTLPFVTGDLIGVSAGALFDWKGIGIAASFMYFVPQTITVSNSSQLRASPALADQMPTNIGNGVYTTSFWNLGIGLYYHWDEG